MRDLNASYFIRSELSQPEWRRLRRDILESSQLEVLEIEPELRPAGLPPGLSWSEIASNWNTLNNTARAAAIAAEVHRIQVTPGRRQEPRFNPSRLIVDWVREAPTGPEPDPTDPRHLWSWHNRQPAVPDWIPTAKHLRSLHRPLNAPEACRIADTAPKDLQRAVRNGHLKPATAERVEFLVDHIDAWINTRPRQRPASETPQSESPSTGG